MQCKLQLLTCLREGGGTQCSGFTIAVSWKSQTCLLDSSENPKIRARLSIRKTFEVKPKNASLQASWRLMAWFPWLTWLFFSAVGHWTTEVRTGRRCENENIKRQSKSWKLAGQIVSQNSLPKDGQLKVPRLAHAQGTIQTGIPEMPRFKRFWSSHLSVPFWIHLLWKRTSLVPTCVSSSQLWPLSEAGGLSKV